ncbi:hypothetical protein LOTGIDRAFT_238010 [Lottia gigantea]|uniref:FAM161 centrosomal protein A n=1 Tax=Lottia gigantea TaxID=225164 RepID=V4B488_LOTGI|nr:hypothetical protein LOTGIDRAFT_238010 [Lottia gigantea]ESP02271.1 hypothetical protein LOTGIDRAFT_238010 [Lottia gigantea]
MATMATGHALSVLANNSLRNPVDSRTGKIATLSSPQKPHNSGIYSRSENGLHVKISANGIGEYTSEPVFSQTNGDATHLSPQLQNLTDEEFYDRLSKMKENQKMTLEKCERLYMEKRALEEKYAASPHNRIFDNEDVDIDTGTMFVNGRFRGHDCDNRLEYSSDYTYSPIKTYDNVCDVRDLTSKPPVAPSPLNRPPSRQGQRPGHSSGHSLTKGISHTQADNRSPPIQWRAVRSRSLNGDGGKNMSDFENELSDEEISGYMKAPAGYMSDDNYLSDDVILRREEVMTPSKLELQRIESMWDDFSINDYAPRQRPSSAPATRRSEKSKKASEWRHRLTIPEPFNMTLREEGKEKRKTITQIEVEAERRRKEQEEELECQKKFQAKPVPAHVYLPLYDEINEQAEAKRRYVRQYCQEMLKSQEKPFKFMKREEYKGNQRRNSEPAAMALAKEKRKDRKFKANPVPAFIYDDSITRKQMEDEEYRKLRISMRSEELLKEAALPPGMEAREKMKQQRIEEIKRQSRARKHFRPKKQKKIPDYDRLYRKFQSELNRRKTELEPTVVEPFRLHTDRTYGDTQKVLLDMARDEEVLMENRWPYQTPRARTPTRAIPRSRVGDPRDSFPAQMTRTAETRNSVVRQSIAKQIENSKKESEAERHRRVREMKLRKSIQEKAGSKNYGQQKVKDRLRQFKEDERLREEQYQSEMEAMKDRVNQQPLLFERQKQNSAKSKAEKKFATTLKNVGLDEDFINSRSSGPNSVRSGRSGKHYSDDHNDDDEDNEDDNDQNNTYTRSRSSERYSDSFEEVED